MEQLLESQRLMIDFTLVCSISPKPDNPGDWGVESGPLIISDEVKAM